MMHGVIRTSYPRQHGPRGTVEPCQHRPQGSDENIYVKLSQGLGIQGNLSNRTLDGTCE